MKEDTSPPPVPKAMKTATFNDAKSSLTNDSSLDHVASMVHTTINQKVRDSVVNYVLCACIISQQDI